MRSHGLPLSGVGRTNDCRRDAPAGTRGLNHYETAQHLAGMQTKSCTNSSAMGHFKAINANGGRPLEIPHSDQCHEYPISPRQKCSARRQRSFSQTEADAQWHSLRNSARNSYLVEDNVGFNRGPNSGTSCRSAEQAFCSRSIPHQQGPRAWSTCCAYAQELTPRRVTMIHGLQFMCLTCVSFEQLLKLQHQAFMT